MNSNKIFTKNFTMVVIGQIISLFGNQALRFALPLYLLNQTNSPSLFGFVSAFSFIPMIILYPIGGIIADRVNKRNVMVFLDFFTSILTILIALFLGKISVVIIVFVALTILYGIQGAYEPAVQASIPALVYKENIMKGNAIINFVYSLAGFVGPVIGGVLYSFWGIMPILYICIICFFLSAVMEIFINIPFSKQKFTENIFVVGFRDFGESIHFMKVDKPCIFKASLVMGGINLFISALIIIGVPIIITKYLDFGDINIANKLYGFAQGAIALGGLLGGLIGAALSKKLKAKYSPIILLLCSITLIPMALSVNFVITPIITFIVISLSCIFMMTFATIFTIQMMSFLQIFTPEKLVGKVISCAICMAVFSQPIGQAMYGTLFDVFINKPYIPFYMAVIVSIIICLLSKSTFREIEEIIDNQ